MIGLLSCAGSAAMIDCIPRRLLWLVVRMLFPCSAVWFDGKDAVPTFDSLLLGEEQIPLLL